VRRGGDLSGVLDNVVIICICGTAVAERVIEAREELLGRRPAIVNITDCQVLRAEHF
jgi:hypothetical protein